MKELKKVENNVYEYISSMFLAVKKYSAIQCLNFIKHVMEFRRE